MEETTEIQPFKPDSSHAMDHLNLLAMAVTLGSSRAADEFDVIAPHFIREVSLDVRDQDRLNDPVRIWLDKEVQSYLSGFDAGSQCFIDKSTQSQRKPKGAGSKTRDVTNPALESHPSMYTEDSESPEDADSRSQQILLGTLWAQTMSPAWLFRPAGLKVERDNLLAPVNRAIEERRGESNALESYDLGSQQNNYLRTMTPILRRCLEKEADFFSSHMEIVSYILELPDAAIGVWEHRKGFKLKDGKRFFAERQKDLAVDKSDPVTENAKVRRQCLAAARLYADSKGGRHLSEVLEQSHDLVTKGHPGLTQDYASAIGDFYAYLNEPDGGAGVVPDSFEGACNQRPRFKARDCGGGYTAMWLSEAARYFANSQLPLAAQKSDDGDGGESRTKNQGVKSRSNRRVRLAAVEWDAVLSSLVGRIKPEKSGGYFKELRRNLILSLRSSDGTLFDCLARNAPDRFPGLLHERQHPFRTLVVEKLRYWQFCESNMAKKISNRNKNRVKNGKDVYIDDAPTSWGEASYGYQSGWLTDIERDFVKAVVDWEVVVDECLAAPSAGKDRPIGSRVVQVASACVGLRVMHEWLIAFHTLCGTFASWNDVVGQMESATENKVVDDLPNSCHGLLEILEEKQVRDDRGRLKKRMKEASVESEDMRSRSGLSAERIAAIFGAERGDDHFDRIEEIARSLKSIPRENSSSAFQAWWKSNGGDEKQVDLLVQAVSCFFRSKNSAILHDIAPSYFSVSPSV